MTDLFLDNSDHLPKFALLVSLRKDFVFLNLTYSCKESSGFIEGDLLYFLHFLENTIIFNQNSTSCSQVKDYRHDTRDS
jgi:hypothetical protein